MTFAYEPSAAGISWLALTQALDSQAQRQGDLMSLYSTNCQVAIQETQTNADQAFQELSSESKGQIQQGIAGLAGAGAGFLAAGACYAGESYCLNKAGQINSPTNTGIKITEVTNTPTTPAASTIPTTDTGVELENPFDRPAGAAEINVSPTNTTAPASTDTDSTPNSAPKDKVVDPRVAAYQARAAQLQQHGSNFSSFANQICTSSGSMASAQQTANAANAKQAEAIAQGIAQVMNAQGQMLTSAADGTNSQMSNTESTLSTIIQVSAVRG